MDEKIPKATPVFRTYVMLKKPSITEIDSLSSNRLWISSLVQRSSMSTATTDSAYGNRPWKLSNLPIGINVDYIRQAGGEPCHMIFSICIFPPRFRHTGHDPQR